MSLRVAKGESFLILNVLKLSLKLAQKKDQKKLYLFLFSVGLASSSAEEGAEEKCGYRLMVNSLSSKQDIRVRFPLSAKEKKSYCFCILLSEPSRSEGRGGSQLYDLL